jgi:hypothetical protein
MMDERLSDIRLKVAVVRRALDDCRQRLAALRGHLLDSRDSALPAADDGGRVPLFQATPPLDDRELHFEALDTEDPGREKR